MAKENILKALDNVLALYRKDRLWLSILCRMSPRDALALLKSKKITYGELQAFLLRGGIRMTITVSKHQPPKEGSPRLQFLRNAFRLNGNRTDTIATVTKNLRAPDCWFEQDDIPIASLNDMENVFSKMDLQYNFTGFSNSQEPDVTYTKPPSADRKRIENAIDNPKDVGYGCRKRFEEACREMYPNGIPAELLVSEAVLQSVPSDLIRKNKKETPAQQPQPTGKKETSRPTSPMNEQTVMAKMKETGLDRDVAGGLAYADLDHEALSERDDDTFKRNAELAKNILDYLESEYSWFNTLLRKKGIDTREALFLLKKADLFTKMASGKISLTMSDFCDALAENDYGLSVRFFSDAKLEQEYAELRTGFLQKWILNNDTRNKIFQKKTTDALFNDDDMPMDTAYLKLVTIKTGESISICLYRLSSPWPRPAAEMAPIYAPGSKPARKTETEQRHVQKETFSPRLGATAEPRPEPTVDPYTEPFRPYVSTWLKQQPEYNDLATKLGALSNLLDGRYGADTVNAGIKLYRPENLRLALLSRRLMKTVKTGKLTIGNATQPDDIETRRLISKNRAFIESLDCIDTVVENLKKSSAKSMPLSQEIPTTDGHKTLSVAFNNDELLITYEDGNGEPETAASSEPYLLTGYFTLDDWFEIAHLSVRHAEQTQRPDFKNALEGSMAKYVETTQTVDRCLATYRECLRELHDAAKDTFALDGFSATCYGASYDNARTIGGVLTYDRTKDGMTDTVTVDEMDLFVLAQLYTQSYYHLTSENQ